MTNHYRLTNKEKVCYGLGDCGAAIFSTLFSSFSTAYYTDTVGIAVAAVGTMAFISEIINAFTDLIMGGVIDKTKSKYGKARPWILWTAPFMAVGGFLMFNVPAGLSDKQNLIYAYLSFLLMNCVIYTANNVPYHAMLSRMTLNPQDRISTSSLRTIMTSVAGLIVTVMATTLRENLGWSGLTIIFGILEIILFSICFFGCKEHVGIETTGSEKAETVPLRVALPALFKNKYFYIQLLSFATFYMILASRNSTALYYCNVILKNPAMMGVFSTISTIVMILTNLATPKLSEMYGKRKVMVAGCVILCAGQLLLGLANTSVTLVILGQILVGVGSGPIASGIFARTSDVVDYGEWKYGVRSDGLISSCASFGMKAGAGFGVALGTKILSAGGYDGMAAVQSAAATMSIRVAFGYLGFVLSILALLCLLAMNLDKYLPTIQHDLENRKNVAKA